MPSDRDTGLTESSQWRGDDCFAGERRVGFVIPLWSGMFDGWTIRANDHAALVAAIRSTRAEAERAVEKAVMEGVG